MIWAEHRFYTTVTSNLIYEDLFSFGNPLCKVLSIIFSYARKSESSVGIISSSIHSLKYEIPAIAKFPGLH